MLRLLGGLRIDISARWEGRVVERAVSGCMHVLIVIPFSSVVGLQVVRDLTEWVLVGLYESLSRVKPACINFQHPVHRQRSLPRDT